MAKQIQNRAVDAAVASINSIRDRLQAGLAAARDEIASELGLDRLREAGGAADRDHRRAKDALAAAVSREAETRATATTSRAKLRAAEAQYVKLAGAVEQTFATPPSKASRRGR